MKFLDKVLGRSEPPRPDLDQLFALPGAALTLQAATGLTPTGLGAVAFREAEGAASAGVRRDVVALLDADEGPDVERSVDSYGFTWLLVRHEPSDLAGLVTDLHAVNASLVDAGFGPTLLCSLVGFTDDSHDTDDAADTGKTDSGDGREGTGGRRLALVYLYKRGTFYPFAPTGAQTRDSAFELQVRGAVGSDLPVEADVSRWFPVWGAPGL